MELLNQWVKFRLELIILKWEIKLVLGLLQKLVQILLSWSTEFLRVRYFEVGWPSGFQCEAKKFFFISKLFKLNVIGSYCFNIKTA